MKTNQARMEMQGRPVAETVLMILRIIMSTPPHTGVTINAVAQMRNNEPCMTFRSNTQPYRSIDIIEPQFEKIDYDGVTLYFNGENNISPANYRGTGIANIAEDIFKFLA